MPNRSFQHHDHPVILTRPIVQAQLQAQMLGVKAGWRRPVELFPCMEICPLDDYAELDTALSHLQRYAMLAFVSPNAIHFTMERLQLLGLVLPQTLCLAVMGAGSKQCLFEYGINEQTHQLLSPLDSERTDSETLLQVLDISALQGRTVLIVRGQDGRELLADQLRQHGVNVEQVPAYRRQVPEWNPVRQARFRALLDCGADWVVSSSEILRTLLDWAKKLDQLDNILPNDPQIYSANALNQSNVAKMQQQRVIVPHRRIAENAQILGFESITFTGAGDEQLFVALQSRL